MNVLSLFNGFGGAFLALEKANVKFNKMYVSEVDKHAMQVADAINPSNINLGSVCDVDVSKLDKIDVLCGGSPCQSFSFAGKRKGMSTTCELKITTLEQYLELKENNFEFEGQSYLFWEYMRILKDIQKYNPNVLFFLENVVMTKDWEHILSTAIGIKPVMINSSLLSAQNRKRLYWSNIKTRKDGFFDDVVQDIEQPEDLGILLKDVLESEVDEKYYLSDDIVGKFTTNFYQMDGYRIDNQAFYEDNKHGTLDTKPYRTKVLISGCDYRTDEGFIDRANGKSGTLAARVREDESCGQLVKESLIIPEATEKGYCEIEPGGCVDLENINSKTRRGRKMEDKSNTLMASTTQFHKYEGNLRIRRLTPRECFRLQTVAEKHIDTILNCGVSNSQLYKMCGNGWTIDVIAHFFKEMNNAEAQQQSLF